MGLLVSIFRLIRCLQDTSSALGNRGIIYRYKPMHCAHMVGVTWIDANVILALYDLLLFLYESNLGLFPIQLPHIRLRIHFDCLNYNFSELQLLLYQILAWQGSPSLLLKTRVFDADFWIVIYLPIGSCLVVWGSLWVFGVIPRDRGCGKAGRRERER